MPATRMYVNGIDLATFGLYLLPADGFMGPVGKTVKLVEVPGAAGAIRVSRESQIPARRFTVSGTMIATSDAIAAANFDALFQLLGSESLMEFKLVPWLDRAGYGYFEVPQIAWPGTLTKGAKITLNFVMPNPYKYALQEDVYTLQNNIPVALTLGNAPSHVTLDIMGNGGTTPMVFYSDHQGVMRGDAGYAGPLIAGDWVRYWGQYGLSYYYRATPFAVFAYDASAVVDRRIIANPLDKSSASGPTLLAQNCSAVARLRKAWL
jgi:phage-related protein